MIPALHRSKGFTFDIPRTGLGRVWRGCRPGWDGRGGGAGRAGTGVEGVPAGSPRPALPCAE